MGDLSAEPSMEDILSSIKRIIAEEGDQPARRARPARAASLLAQPVADPDEEVLELREPLPASRVEPPARAPEPVAERRPDPAPRTYEPARPAPPPAAPEPPEPIVSSEAVAASRGALESLSRLMVKPEPGNDGTLEGMVREMIRPMLREWLDANLPEMVETMVGREIARIAGQAG